jgi:hypothetical protein
MLAALTSREALMNKRWWVGLLLVGCSCAAMAAGPAAVRKQLEASMAVTGSIDIEPDGSVSGFTLAKRNQLPPAVTGLIDAVVPQWRFEPIKRNGESVKARAKMSLLMMATRSDDDHFKARIAGASFGDEQVASGETVAAIRMTPPHYPAAVSNVTGSVYLVIRIDRQGQVEDAVVEQVDLRVVADERSMERLRTAFANSALAATKSWRFAPPTVGMSANEPFWTARVPIDYQLEGSEPKYGKWQAYIPGPRQKAPWLHEGELDAWALPDTLTAGGIYQIGAGPHLLTPPGQG